jgi:hypothetical protein
MVLMGGVDLPTRAIREQAASALDLIVHQARLRDGTRRVTHITEITGMESDVITTQDLFAFDYHAGVDRHGRYLGSLRSTGIRPTFLVGAPSDRLCEGPRWTHTAIGTERSCGLPTTQDTLRLAPPHARRGARTG